MKIDCFASSSSGNAYKVSSNTEILLELGIPVNKIMKGGSLPPFALLTHEHNDHAGFWKEYAGLGGKIITSKGTADALGGGDCFMTIESFKAIQVGGLEIMAFPVVHGVPEHLAEQGERAVADPFGFLISDGEKTLLFATDTVNIFYTFQGITNFLIECNWDEETISPSTHETHLAWAMDSHMSLKTCKEFLKRHTKSAEEVILCHLSAKNARPEKMAKEVKAIVGVPVGVCGKSGGIKFY